MPIFTEFTPNMGKSEIKQAFKNFFVVEPNEYEVLKKEIEEEFGMRAYFYDSGRSALLKILEAMPKDKRDEVLVQAYTCVVVVNAIKAAGYKPVYVDVEQNGVNVSLDDLEKKISNKTRAIIVQHTFGFPDQIDDIKKLAHENKIFLIEDLAHSVTATFNKHLLGTFADASFISLGVGKIISAGRGGVALTKKMKLDTHVKQMEGARKHLFKIIVFGILKPVYFFLKIGKAELYLFSKMGLLPRVITESEKNGKAPKVYGFNPRLGALALMQWKSRNSSLEHRRKIAAIYNSNLDGIVKCVDFNEEAAYMRFPIFVKNPRKLFKFMKKHHILLGVEWSGAVIVPKSIDLRRTKYKGGCKQAEKTALTVITLPTDIHITPKKAELICDLIKTFYGN